MEPARRSRTAEAAAFLRALHRHVDAAPWVFEDAAVEALLSPPGQRFLRRLDTRPWPWISAFSLRRSGLASMRAQLVVRARYAEDALSAHGPHQYLVLAAGLDSVRPGTAVFVGAEVERATQNSGAVAQL